MFKSKILVWFYIVLLIWTTMPYAFAASDKPSFGDGFFVAQIEKIVSFVRALGSVFTALVPGAPGATTADGKIFLDAFEPRSGVLYHGLRGRHAEGITSIRFRTSLKRSDIKDVQLLINDALQPLPSWKVYEGAFGPDMGILDTGLLFPNRAFTNGSNNIAITLRANDGRSATNNLSFNYDDDLPVMSDVQKTANGETFTVRDTTSGIASIEASDGKQMLSSLSGLGNNRFSIQFGTHNADKVLYRVTDRAGNVEIFTTTGKKAPPNGGSQDISKIVASLKSVLNAPKSPPGGQKNAALNTTCVYPKQIVFPFVYDPNVPADNPRSYQQEFQKATTLAEGYSPIFDVAFEDLNDQLTDVGYPVVQTPLISVTTIPFTVAEAASKLNGALSLDTGGYITLDEYKLDTLKNFISKTPNAVPIVLTDSFKGGSILGVTDLLRGIIVLADDSVFYGTEETMLHEIGHSSGLDHWPSNGNLMQPAADFGIFGQTHLEPNQLFAWIAHLCGEPGYKITFQGQSGDIGINIYATIPFIGSNDSQCGNGLIGTNEAGVPEQCEESLLHKLTNGTGIEKYCVGPSGPNSVPHWPDQYICSNACQCDTMGGGGGAGPGNVIFQPPPPPPPPPTPPAITPGNPGAITPGSHNKSCTSNADCPSDAKCVADPSTGGSICLGCSVPPDFCKGTGEVEKTCPDDTKVKGTCLHCAYSGKECPEKPNAPGTAPPPGGGPTVTPSPAPQGATAPNNTSLFTPVFNFLKGLFGAKK